MPTTNPHPPKPKRRWYQFSLRTLLVFVLLVSVGLNWLGVKMHQARKQREAVEAILEAGGEVAYGYQFKEDGASVPGATPPGPAWLRKLLGDDFFRDVIRVSLELDSGGAELEHLEGLSELRRVNLASTQVTDVGLEHIKGLTKLETLFLDDTKITDTGLEHLKGLTNLKSLGLSHTQVTDEGTKNLQEALPNCVIDLLPLPPAR